MMMGLKQVAHRGRNNMLETLKSSKLFSLFSYGSTVTLISVPFYGMMKKVVKFFVCYSICFILEGFDGWLIT